MALSVVPPTFCHSSQAGLVRRMSRNGIKQARNLFTQDASKAGMPPAIHAYLGGHAARSEDYMRTHWAFAKGFVEAATLEAAAVAEETSWQDAQKEGGLSFLSPAYVRWEDILRPFCRDGTAVSPGSLTRTFETNTFHRQPIATGNLPVLGGEALQAVAPLPQSPWTLTLPSPWDVACRTKSAHGDRSQVALEAAFSIAPLVEAAFTHGAALVRFHDPSALYARQARPLAEVFAEALAVAAGRHKESCTLHLTNGELARRPELAECNPLGGLSIEPLDEKPAFTLANGIRLTVASLEGQESLVETPAALTEAAQRTASLLDAPLWGITNGWDLDHVPHAIALRKIESLAQSVHLLEVAA
jgi:methionine synthase II (cobalamin-independent)